MLITHDRQRAFRERKLAQVKGLELKIMQLTSTLCSLQSEKQRLEQDLYVAHHKGELLKAAAKCSTTPPVDVNDRLFRSLLSKCSPRCYAECNQYRNSKYRVPCIDGGPGRQSREHLRYESCCSDVHVTIDTHEFHDSCLCNRLVRAEPRRDACAFLE